MTPSVERPDIMAAGRPHRLAGDAGFQPSDRESEMTSKLLPAAVIAATAFPLAAIAANLTVVNPSFEMLPPAGLPYSCGYDCKNNYGPIPGWTAAQVSGQVQFGPQLGSYLFFNYIPDGITVLVNNSGLPVYQTISATAVAGLTYTLSVDIGYGKNYVDPGYAALVVNGNATIATGTAQPQYSGNWSTFTASYTATRADAGMPITIQLISSSQGVFDDVLLTDNATGVPEPAGWSLTLIGLASLGAMVRGRRARTQPA